jgi:hypothetical protein
MLLYKAPKMSEVRAAKEPERQARQSTGITGGEREISQSLTWVLLEHNLHSLNKTRHNGSILNLPFCVSGRRKVIFELCSSTVRVHSQDQRFR